MEIVLIVALCGFGVVLLAYGLRPGRELRLPRDGETDLEVWDEVDHDIHVDAGGIIIDLDVEKPDQSRHLPPRRNMRRPPTMPGA